MGWNDMTWLDLISAEGEKNAFLLITRTNDSERTDSLTVIAVLGYRVRIHLAPQLFTDESVGRRS